ncbi:MAG: hypothetical protein QOF61_1331 [Acidobacteriota bacterium]|nr:hypothetical protein [Acidobacteriota bacterium]
MRRKSSWVVVLVAAVLVCVVGWKAKSQITRSAVAPRKWEYTTVSKIGKLNEETLRPEMSLLGVNGWELVTAYNDGAKTILFFKRPL